MMYNEERILKKKKFQLKQYKYEKIVNKLNSVEMMIIVMCISIFFQLKW